MSVAAATAAIPSASSVERFICFMVLPYRFTQVRPDSIDRD
ncbi:MAG TPA: hypothetical protein ACN46L_01645 [Prochlorococcus sp.]